MIKQISAGGIVLNKSGKKVIVVHQGGVSWSLPKGHVEKNETFEETAKREIFEETGVMDLKLIRKFRSYERYKISKDGKGETKTEFKELHFFLFQTNVIKLKPGEDITWEARWVDIDKVADLLTHPKDKDFFRRVFNKLHFDL